MLLLTPPMTVTYSLRDQHCAGSARRWHAHCHTHPAWTKPQLQEFPQKAKLSPGRGGGSCGDKSQSLTVGFKHYVTNKERQLDNPGLSPSPGCRSLAAPQPPASCCPPLLCFLSGGYGAQEQGRNSPSTPTWAVGCPGETQLGCCRDSQRLSYDRDITADMFQKHPRTAQS